MRSAIGGKRLAWLLAYLYFTSYVTRINFAAVIQEVITNTGFDKSALSIVLVCLSVSYGIGQIVNGKIGDMIKPQNLILIGLCTATAVNYMFPLCASSIPTMCVLWTLNGFAQAMIWPPIIKIMVTAMDEAAYGFSVVTVSMGASAGTVSVYLAAPIFIRFLSWKWMMFSSATLGLISIFVWFSLKDRCYREMAHSEKSSESKHFQTPREAILPFVFIAFGIILQGMIRDGVTSWMPTYLTENFGLGNDTSIFMTVSLAIVSMISFVIVGSFYKKFFKNEVLCAAVIFGFSAICTALLLTFFDNGSALFTTLILSLITGAMHGINLMLVSHVPKRFKNYGNISTVSGLVNSFTYIGAAVATYGIASLSESFGWKFTVIIWLAVILMGTAVCLIASSSWKKFISISENPKT